MTLNDSTGCLCSSTDLAVFFIVITIGAEPVCFENLSNWVSSRVERPISQMQQIRDAVIDCENLSELTTPTGGAGSTTPTGTAIDIASFISLKISLMNDAITWFSCTRVLFLLLQNDSASPLVHTRQEPKLRRNVLHARTSS